ncbi:hypothetical protein LTR91_025697 [Friedmanniomyces endolithicus]|uniref:Uncharacterized protein n=1 Tax=Friedmanniomyces endolithicus TaxID=329885 RepID=A0AAN6JWB8_9PEZI|nr:hypothetical protein LTR91_025697 [Friedmanniomyces endolithicus]KAK0951259.1 hypothetical protein LTS01_025322 [Friedmanniomyces endolithicus]KAK1021085.1 hypothetical protein LTS16_026743 [Friedmanniomyces endolithicus]
MFDYKPTEHDGLRKDGQPDQRVNTGGGISLSPSADTFLSNLNITEFAGGKVDPHEAGAKGGQSSGGGLESGGSSDDTGSKGQFAGGKVDPVEAGKKGGKS